MERSEARWIGCLFPILIGIVTFAAFFPVLQNGFVSWDDNAMLLGNVDYRGLGWAQLCWMFTTFYMDHYQPLSWVTLGLDYLIWGMNPFGYHLTSLLLHCVNAVLFYWVALRLLYLSTSCAPRKYTLQSAAGLAALLFAIHPLRVESVAWATERRDVLSAMFLLFTILSYLRAAKAETDARYKKWLSLAAGLYLLSLLSKAVGITLPLILLVLDVYPLRRLGGGAGKWFGPSARKVWQEKVPFILLAAGAAAVAVEAQSSAMRSLIRHSIDARLAQTFFGLVFYLWKTVAPTGLSPLYEIPLHLSILDWLYLVCAIAVVALTLLFVKIHESLPAGLAVWIYYVAMLAPVLGIAQSGPQLVADRYSYLSCLGWALLAAGGFLWVLGRWLDEGSNKIVTISALVLLPLGLLSFLTWKQTQVWHDSETLYHRVLFITPNSRIAHNNLAGVLLDQGRVGEATKHYFQALQIDPNYEWTHYNLARLLAAQGKDQEAAQRFRRALEINPNFLLAHHHLGVLLTRQDKLEEALAHFSRATEIDSSYVEGHNNIGLILAAQGRIEEAIQQYHQALEIKPAFALAEVNLGDALMLQGRMDEAIEHYRKAVANDPNLAVGHYSLGVALARKGDLEDAVNHLRRAIQIEPQNARMRQSLEELLVKQGMDAHREEQRRKKAAIAP